MSTQGQDPGQDRVKIRQLPTGVPGLDEILGGGLPEYSFNIIAGAPGGGKTTLAHQIMFANASPERPALYFTVLGEPAIKMLRYQQQFTFFDPAKLGRRDPLRQPQPGRAGKDLGAVLEEIVKEVEASKRRDRRGGFVPHGGAQGAEPARAKWSSRASSSGWPCT